jgi:hypothetical protein
MDPIIYYKVLFRNKYSELLSAYVSTGITCYKKGEATWPLPDHGPLCVFTTLEQAQSFVKYTAGNEIWECEIVVSCEDSVWCPTGFPFTEPYSLTRSVLPDGTVLATKVVLTKCVHEVIPGFAGPYC